MRPLAPGSIALAAGALLAWSPVAHGQARVEGAAGLDAPAPSVATATTPSSSEPRVQRGFPPLAGSGAARPADPSLVHTPEGYGAAAGSSTPGPSGPRAVGTGRWPLHTPDGAGPGSSHSGAEARDVPVREPLPAAERHRNTFTFNPVALVVGILQFQYERGIGDHVSLFLGPSFLFYDPVGGFEGSIFAFGADLGARFVLGRSARAPEGFWVGPAVGLLYARIEDSLGTEAQAFGYSLSGLLGYTWLWGRFVFSVGGGISYVDIDADIDGDRLGYSGIEPAARLSIGVAF